MLIVWGISLIFAFPLVISSKNALPHSIACNVLYFCGGVFEQLARYTTRYQESDLHLGLSANNLNLPTLITLFYFSTLLYSSLRSATNFSSSSSSIVADFIAKAGHVWVYWPKTYNRVSIVCLTANIATGLPLLGNRLAYAPQLTSTKGPRSALTPHPTTCKKLTSDNAKRITFLIWQ